MLAGDSAVRVLWVLSMEQRVEYKAEIASTEAPGVKFVFRDSPEDALEELPQIKPRLVVVGMTNDEMDGLEFLALLMRPKLGFAGKVIVLPDKGDPYPPMLQWRDADTGRSATEEITVADLGKHVAALVSAPTAASVPAKKPAKPVVAQPPATVRRPTAAKPERPFASASPPAGPPDEVFDAATVRPPAPAPTLPVPQVDSGLAPPPPVRALSPQELLADIMRTTDAPEGPAGKPAPPSAPVAAPPPAPVAAPLFAPVAAPISAPVAAPISAPVAAAVSAPVAAPISAPLAAPIAAPVAAPISAPVAAPISAPVAASPTATPAALERSVPIPLIVGAAGVALALVLVIGVVISQMGDDDQPAPEPGAELADIAQDEPVEPEPQDEPVDPEPQEPQDEPEAATAPLLTPTTLPVRFNTGDARFRIQSRERMAEIVGQLRDALDANPEAMVEVGGHTSSHGPSPVNQRLGQARATKVRDYLVSHEIPLERIVIRNYHSSSPAEQAHADRAHRRVTVRIID